MTALILDFGGQRDAVCAALKRVFRSRPIRILVLLKAQENELAYQAFDAGLSDALTSFANGNLSSVQLHGEGSSTFVGSVYGPSFAGSVLEDCSGSVEGFAIEHRDFDDLRSIEGLSYVALSTEESPDFDVPHVTKETFPWSDWRLVAGAVRTEDGQWSVRCNPGIPGSATKTVYVRLLNEGTVVYRPAIAITTSTGALRLVGPTEYDRDDEEWEFPLGSMVRLESKILEDAEVLVGVAPIWWTDLTA